jgi:hypothetical protein
MKRILLFAALSLVIVMGSCKKEDRPEETSPYSIRITDAPGDYEAVYVNIKEVEIKTDKANYVFRVDKRINLLDYVNGKDTLIFSEGIVTSKVSQIRLVLYEDSNTVVINGITYPLETPSAQQSGLKLNVHHDLIPNVEYTVLLDFDAAKSIVETGSGKYILKPVIRVLTNELFGGIRGTVLPVNSNAAVIAISGTDTFCSYTNYFTGEFKVSGLKDGIYNLSIDANSNFYDTTLLNINVINGDYTDIGIINLREKL